MNVQREQQVALYVRVSTNDQVDGHSLAGQEAMLRSDAALRGKLVYKVYQDAGISGTRGDRQGLNELLRDAKRGCFGEVLVWTVSRVSRKLSYLLQVVEDLKSWGIAFRSMSEQFDVTTPMGQFALTMMGAVAQMQRESWMESSHIGMEKRAKAGRWGGGMMLGYQMVPDEEDPRGGGKLVIVPAEAETVRDVFSLYMNGLGYKAIVNRLNAQGKIGKNGKAFTSNTVSGILTNAAYIGKTRFGDEYFDGIQEPIISSEVWGTVQEIMKGRSQPVRKTIDREYLLTGVLKCPICGSGMVPTHTKNKRSDGSYRSNHYYACGSYLNRGSAICRPNHIRADQAEDKVLTWLQEFLTSSFWLCRVTEAIRLRYEAITKPRRNERQQAEQQLASIAKRQSELLRHYEDDALGRESFLAEMQQLKAEKERWQAKLTASEPKAEFAATWSIDDVRGAFRAFRQVLVQAKSDQKKQLIRNLIAKIKVNADRQVSEIELKLMPDLAANGEVETMSMQVAI